MMCKDKSVKGICFLAGLAMITGLQGCVLEEELEREELGETAEAIRWGTNVAPGSAVLDTTVALGCTGTIIGPRHVLTAAHCKPRNNRAIGFYDNNVGYDPSYLRSVIEVWERYGVDDIANDLYDIHGNFADFAVLTLNADIPSFARPARLPHWQAGFGTQVQAVGQGAHDGNANGIELLRYRDNYIEYWQDGTVNTRDGFGDPGDSGGPLYTSWDTTPMVHGALWGTFYDYGAAEHRGRYTSTWWHRWRILTAMGHRYYTDADRPGGDYAVRTGWEVDQCAIACMQDARCVAYTFASSSSTCRLKDEKVGSRISAPGVRYGYKREFAKCEPDPQGVCRIPE